MHFNVLIQWNQESIILWTLGGILLLNGMDIVKKLYGLIDYHHSIITTTEQRPHIELMPSK